MKSYRRRIYLIFLPIIGFTPQAFPQDCDLRQRENLNIEVQVQGRTIALIGWEHPLQATYEPLARTLENLPQMSCSSARLALQNHVRNQSEDLKQAERVLRILRETHRRTPLAIIGLEMTQNEILSEMRGRDKTQQALHDFLLRCPSIEAPLVQQFLLLTHGPEYVFHHPSVEQIALEDEDLKIQNAHQIEAANREGLFDFENPRITTTGRRAITEIRAAVARQQQPQERLIDIVVSYEPNRAQRQRLREGVVESIELWKIVIAGAYARNMAIIEGILTKPGNMAVPIGSAHLNHLAQELQRRCRAL